MSFFRGLGLLAVLFSLWGCAQASKPELPEEVWLAQGMANALIDTGFYTEVGVTRVIGSHYRPGENAWTVLGCYNYSTANGERGNNCVDSFELRLLENGPWVVGVTIEEVYRWRQISFLREQNNAQTTESSESTN